MEVRCKLLYKRYGGCYGRWIYKTRVIQLVDFPDVYLEIYSDVNNGHAFRGYAPITSSEIPRECNMLDLNNVCHIVKHDCKVVIKLETEAFGTFYRLPLYDDDRNLVDTERQVSDEEFNRIVGILHSKKVDSCEDRKVKK